MAQLKILGITGPSGCGKDTAARWLADKYPNICKYVKLHTTRPQRNEEDTGYYFYDSTSFLKEVLNGNMLNAQEFRGWYYGLHKEALYEDYINVLPMNNEMIQQMLEENRNDYDLKIIYIDTDDKQRLMHILQRETNPDCHEVCRRFLSDEIDYGDIIKEQCEYTVINRYTPEFFFSLARNAAACFEVDKDSIASFEGKTVKCWK